VLNVPPSILRGEYSAEVIELLPRDTRTTTRLFPFHVGNRLFIAMADPLNVLQLTTSSASQTRNISAHRSEKAIVDKLNAFDAAKGGSMEDSFRTLKAG